MNTVENNTLIGAPLTQELMATNPSLTELAELCANIERQVNGFSFLAKVKKGDALCIDGQNLASILEINLLNETVTLKTEKSGELKEFSFLEFSERLDFGVRCQKVEINKEYNKRHYT